MEDYTGKYYIMKKYYKHKEKNDGYYAETQVITIINNHVSAKIYLHTCSANWECTPEELDDEWVEVENPREDNARPLQLFG